MSAILKARITEINAVIILALITGMFCNLILPLNFSSKMWGKNYSYSLDSTAMFSSSSLLYFLLECHSYFCWLPWMGLCILGSGGIEWGGHRYIISVFPALLSASVSVHVHDTRLCNNSTTHTYHLLSLHPVLVIVLPTLLVLALQGIEYWK